MQNEIDDEYESENEVMDFTFKSRKDLNSSIVTKLEIPISVQQVIYKIEQAQLLRAREVGSKMRSLQVTIFFSFP